MPFNTLLLVSLITETSLSESGIEVTMNQRAGEKILFFVIDKQSVRQYLGLQGKICDGLVFYTRKDENKKIFCLVELKGSNLNDAVDQVISSYVQLKKSLEQSLTNMSSEKLPLLGMINWKAFIRLRGGSPKDVKRHKKRLEATFGRGNYDIKEDKDLGKFLR